VRAVHSVKEVRESLNSPKHRARSSAWFPPWVRCTRATSNSSRPQERVRLRRGQYFVNPLQFGPERGLREISKGVGRGSGNLQSSGADLVFAPSVEEMYPVPQTPFAGVPPRLTEHLWWTFPSGHFQGMATVVLKLFDIVQPNRAYFGEKDAQQLAVIRRIVRDLKLPIEIVGVPTVREADGLR